MCTMNLDGLIIRQIDGFNVIEKDIEIVEKEFGFIFPSVLKDFYLKYNGAEIKTAYIEGVDCNEYGIHDISPIKFKRKYIGNRCYPMLTEEGELEWSIKLFKEYKTIRELKLIPFACDEGGDVYFWQEATEAVYIIRSDNFDTAIKVVEDINQFFLNYSNKVT